MDIMCRCPRVHFYEVEFKLDGMKSLAYHKNCGEVLSDQQFSEFKKQLLRSWGIKEEEE
ncbi:MAG: hypothetical protein KatS3mg003_1580 [Candidatus Nitrosocaldaceae archaeon]|nr:MAG: hypothetical protein KatS3mg003_1580 [Candidatus Nitrosocaldaceae archaeon]